MRLSAGTDRDDQLHPEVVYRLQVRAGNAYGELAWSAPAFIYPTSSPPMPTTEIISSLPYIATAPLYGYQPKNDEGNHEFEYVICDGTKPDGVNLNANRMAAAVDKWETAVKKSPNSSMIVTTRNANRDTDFLAEACQPAEPRIGSDLSPRQQRGSCSPTTTEWMKPIVVRTAPLPVSDQAEYLGKP